ncbi:MAG: tRNA dihydrouridine synthase [Butyricicoccaceae bacterium]
MKYYLAPLQGLTGYVYRNAYHAFFPPMNGYFAPFISPTNHPAISNREFRDLLPERNSEIPMIPQILTNNAELFCKTSAVLRDLGYQEINLNLGCPSGTVVSKHRGSGLLAFPDELDHFLDAVFSGFDGSISVKTRLGMTQPEEFFPILEIYNRYPIKELTIHPRVRSDFYKNTPNLEIFREALTRSTNPICYNGDLFTATQVRSFCKMFPSVDAVMLGRGVLADPFLLGKVLGTETPDKTRLRRFHDRLYQDYGSVLSGEKQILCKMNELWSYLIYSFTDAGKYAKKIRKARRLSDYEHAVDALFSDCSLDPDAEYLKPEA